MKKSNLLFAFVLTIGLSSCETEKVDSIRYPVDYLSTTINQSSIKVYTNKGEITDTTKINKLIYGCRFTDLNQYSEGLIVLKYLNSRTVTINNLNNSVNDTLSETSHSGIFYWEMKDTIYQPLSTSLTGHYSFNLYKYKPLYFEIIPIPTSSGYAIAMKYKYCHFVKKEGETLFFPMLDIIKLSGGYRKYSLAQNNELNMDSLSILGNTDTIIVQEYSLKFRKRSL